MRTKLLVGKGQNRRRSLRLGEVALVVVRCEEPLGSKPMLPMSASTPRILSRKAKRLEVKKGCTKLAKVGVGSCFAGDSKNGIKCVQSKSKAIKINDIGFVWLAIHQDICSNFSMSSGVVIATSSSSYAISPLFYFPNSKHA